MHWSKEILMSIKKKKQNFFPGDYSTVWGSLVGQFGTVWEDSLGTGQ